MIDNLKFVPDVDIDSVKSKRGWFDVYILNEKENLYKVAPAEI